MKRSKHHRLQQGMRAAAAGLLLASAGAQATILTFDDLDDFADIPQTYGDNVTAVNSGGFVYGVGAGFTPDIVVEYAPASPFRPFNVWQGYGDLDKALGHNSFNVPGELRLIPTNGATVTLHSFELGAFRANYPNSRVRVLDIGGSVLFDTGLFTALLDPVPGAPPTGHYTFPGGGTLSSSTGLRIEVTEFGDLGLDNISFSQTTVPVPAALPLLVSALAGIAALRRRQQ